MTREEFVSLWEITDLYCDEWGDVKATFNYQDNEVFFNFLGYTENDVYDLGHDFFADLREKLSELDELAQEKAEELELNWNDVELQLAEIRFQKTSEGGEGSYHFFSLAYEGGEEDEEDVEEGMCPGILVMHLCFDKEFNFAEGFVETEGVD